MIRVPLNLSRMLFSDGLLYKLTPLSHFTENKKSLPRQFLYPGTFPPHFDICILNIKIQDKLVAVFCAGRKKAAVLGILTWE